VSYDDLARAVQRAEMMELRRGLRWARGRRLELLAPGQRYPAFLGADEAGVPWDALDDAYGHHDRHYADEPCSGAGGERGTQSLCAMGGGVTEREAVYLDVTYCHRRGWRATNDRLLDR
jgi:hypothetical protein